jgi:P27 family predicted phage terminase small subunit
LNKHEPEPTPGEPECPKWLPPEAKAEWRRIVPELLSLKLLTVVDRGALTAYCLAWNELVACTKAMTREGRIISQPVLNRSGKKVGAIRRPNPAARLQRDAFARVKQFLGEFGLSPSSRARLQVPNHVTEKDDPLAALIKRQAEIAARRAASAG